MSPGKMIHRLLSGSIEKIASVLCILLACFLVLSCEDSTSSSGPNAANNGPEPSFGNTLEDVLVDHLDRVRFFIIAQGNPYPGIQWQIKRPGGEFENIHAANHSVLDMQVIRYMDGYQVRVVLQNEHGRAESEPATIHVRPVSKDIEILEQPQRFEVCEQDRNGAYTLSVRVAGGADLKGEWQYRENNTQWIALENGAWEPGAQDPRDAVADILLDLGRFREGTVFRIVFSDEIGERKSNGIGFSVRETSRFTEHPRDRTVNVFPEQNHPTSWVGFNASTSNNDTLTWEQSRDNGLNWEAFVPQVVESQGRSISWDADTSFTGMLIRACALDQCSSDPVYSNPARLTVIVK